MHLDWTDLSMVEATIIKTIESLGYKRIDPGSWFWEKGEDHIHLSNRPDDGLVMKLNSDVKIQIERRR